MEHPDCPLTSCLTVPSHACHVHSNCATGNLSTRNASLINKLPHIQASISVLSSLNLPLLPSPLPSLPVLLLLDVLKPLPPLLRRSNQPRLLKLKRLATFFQHPLGSKNLRDTAEFLSIAPQDPFKVVDFDLLAAAVGGAQCGVVAGFDYEVR